MRLGECIRLHMREAVGSSGLLPGACRTGGFSTAEGPVGDGDTGAEGQGHRGAQGGGGARGAAHGPRAPRVSTDGLPDILPGRLRRLPHKAVPRGAFPPPAEVPDGRAAAHASAQVPTSQDRREPGPGAGRLV